MIKVSQIKMYTDDRSHRVVAYITDISACYSLLFIYILWEKVCFVKKKNSKLFNKFKNIINVGERKFILEMLDSLI